MTDKYPRLKWRHTWEWKGPDFSADIPMDGGRTAWARMHVEPSGKNKWGWSVKVGDLNAHGGTLSKQECADQATKAVWDLKRRDDLARDIPRDEPFEIDFDWPTEMLQDYLFIIRSWFGTPLTYGTAPPHISEIESKLRRVIFERTGRADY
jgi:hypothetical protein